MLMLQLNTACTGAICICLELFIKKALAIGATNSQSLEPIRFTVCHIMSYNSIFNVFQGGLFWDHFTFIPQF